MEHVKNIGKLVTYMYSTIFIWIRKKEDQITGFQWEAAQAT